MAGYRKNTKRRAAFALTVVMLLPCVAHAQLTDLLKNGTTGGGGGIGGLSSALSGGSMTSGSVGNVAGILQFCVKNNYLSGSSADSVKSSLMSKLPGGSTTTDSGYKDGSSGILNANGGQKVDLSGGGLKEQVTKQVCDKILAQGKSML